MFTNEASKLNNEQVEVVCVQRVQGRGMTFHHRAICYGAGDPHTPMYMIPVDMFAEHRKMFKDAAIVVDWNAREVEFRTPVNVILRWDDVHRNLRIDSVVTD